MDRFKFRAWDKKRKHMDTCFHMFAGTGLACQFSNDTVWALVDGNGDDQIVMQCTGLKDKNGKLIYEGDILRIAHVNRGDFLAKIIWQPDYCRFGFEELDHAALHFGYKCFGEDDEIIGNIHENPELIEAEKKVQK